MPSYKLLYTITVGGMSGNTTHQDTDVLDLDAPLGDPKPPRRPPASSWPR